MTTIVRRRKLGMTSIRGICAASTTGITFANNYETIPEDDIYIRWGCTSSVPNREATIINRANGIHTVADKTGFRRIMQEGEQLCPRTYFSMPEVLDSQSGGPFIVRTRNHAQGRGLWLCNNPAELQNAIAQAGADCYVNDFIPKVAEFRVFVLQGQVVWVAQKTPGNPDEVAWNVAKGGRFDNVRWGDWNLAVIQNALKVAALTGLHFAGIDVMLDDRGAAWCVEANSAPSQTSPYRQQCVARAFDHMITTDTVRLRDRVPVPEFIHGYRDVIHPGVQRD